MLSLGALTTHSQLSRALVVARAAAHEAPVGGLRKRGLTSPRHHLLAGWTSKWPHAHCPHLVAAGCLAANVINNRGGSVASSPFFGSDGAPPRRQGRLSLGPLEHLYDLRPVFTHALTFLIGDRSRSQVMWISSLSSAKV